MLRSSSFLKIRPSLILTFLKFLFFIRLVSVSNDLRSWVYLFVLLGFASSKMVRRSSREIASRRRWWRHSRPFADQSRRVEKFNRVGRRDSSPPVRRTCNGRTTRTPNSGTGLGRQSNGLFKLKVSLCLFYCVASWFFKLTHFLDLHFLSQPLLWLRNKPAKSQCQCLTAQS